MAGGVAGENPTSPLLEEGLGSDTFRVVKGDSVSNKKNGLVGILACLAVFLTVAYGQDNKVGSAGTDTGEGPQVCQPAPDFELPWADQAGVHTPKNEWVKLSGLRGSNIILAFYVADWTGG